MGVLRDAGTITFSSPLTQVVVPHLESKWNVPLLFTKVALFYVFVKGYQFLLDFSTAVVSGRVIDVSCRE